MKFLCIMEEALNAYMQEFFLVISAELALGEIDFLEGYNIYCEES